MARPAGRVGTFRQESPVQRQPSRGSGPGPWTGNCRPHGFCRRRAERRSAGAATLPGRPQSRCPSRTWLGTQLAEVLACDTSACRSCHRLCHRSVFGAKSAQNGQLRKVRFFVSDGKWDACASSFARFRSKAGSRRSLCSGFRFQPGKQANSIPPSLSPLVKRAIGPKSAQKRPSSRLASLSQ